MIRYKKLAGQCIENWQKHERHSEVYGGRVRLSTLYSDPTKLMKVEEGVLKGLPVCSPRKVDGPTYEIVGVYILVSKK